MSLQSSTFNTSRALDNEIIKASDFNFAFEQVIENVSKATQMILESEQDFVINGKVVLDTGMNLKVSPIYGVCKSTGKPFGRTELSESIGFEGSSSGRIDIIEVQGGGDDDDGQWTNYDNQQRAFNDPDTDTQSYQYVDTKKLLQPVYRVIKGVEGSGVAPDVETGWVKLAEISIRAGVTQFIASDIHNITSDVAGLDNEDWTNEEDITYNIGYISEVNERFRVQHNADGTHADNSINQDSLDIGTGTKQINANVLPIGGNVSIPTETIAATDSILSVITKAAAMITSLYNAYLKYGAFNFAHEVSISSLVDSQNLLTKPISISAAGDGTAVIKVDNVAVLTFTASGQLAVINNYSATANNHLVTKAVTDALSLAITDLDERVDAIEQSSGGESYANGVISSGTGGRFNPDNTHIDVATTENITLAGIQNIDGVTLNEGDTVLVKDQTNKKENGIYQYSTNSAWSRILDFPEPESLIGKIFTVISGTVNAKKMFYMPDVTFTSQSYGEDNITFLEYFGSTFVLPEKIIMRDECGRAKVAAPSASDDIARKAEIDALYGNTAGQALAATAAVGTATTFARSDHVHPYTSVVADACNSACLTRFAYSTSAISNPSYLAGWDGYTLKAVCRTCVTVGWANHVPTSQPDSVNGAIWVC